METTVNTWYLAVPVATVWTSPESAREIDEAGTDESSSVNRMA